MKAAMEAARDEVIAALHMRFAWYSHELGETRHEATYTVHVMRAMSSAALVNLANAFGLYVTEVR